jgi:hypothetical protein
VGRRLAAVPAGSPVGVVVPWGLRTILFKEVDEAMSALTDIGVNTHIVAARAEHGDG